MGLQLLGVGPVHFLSWVGGGGLVEGFSIICSFPQGTVPQRPVWWRQSAGSPTGSYLSWLVRMTPMNISNEVGVDDEMSRNPRSLLWAVPLPVKYWKPLPHRQERIRRCTM